MIMLVLNKKLCQKPDLREVKNTVLDPNETNLISAVKICGQYFLMMLVLIAFVMTALCGTAMTSLFDTEFTNSESTRSRLDAFEEHPFVAKPPKEFYTENPSPSHQPAVAHDHSSSVFTIRTKSGVTSGKTKENPAHASLFQKPSLPTHFEQSNIDRSKSKTSSLFESFDTPATNSRRNYKSSYLATAGGVEDERRNASHADHQSCVRRR